MSDEWTPEGLKRRDNPDGVISTIRPGSIWTPTLSLRWAGKPLTERVLQQGWVNEDGDVEWRNVTTEE